MKQHGREVTHDREEAPSCRSLGGSRLVCAFLGLAAVIAVAGCSRVAIDEAALLRVALAAVQELRDGELRDGLRRALDPDPDEDAKQLVELALRVRARLELVAERARSGALAEALHEVDDELADSEAALDLLSDDEYLAAVHGAPVAEDRWWGKRAAMIRELPMTTLARALGRSIESPRPPGPAPAGVVAAGLPEADGVKLAPGPLDALDVDAVWEIHRRGMPAGLAPTREALRRMLDRDRVFGAFAFGKLVAVVHARVLPAESSMAATDIEDHDGRRPRGELIAPLETDQAFVVCHAAVTHPDHRGARITQRLIAEVVLPYLAADRELRELSWYTSSPLTHFVSTGRRLARTPALAELVEVGEGALRAARPNGWGSFGELITEAWPWLSKSWLADLGSGPREAAADPPAFFSSLYGALPSHEELMSCRWSDERAAATMAGRVTRLYARAEDRARRAHAATFVLVFLAAAFTQAGVYGEDGRPVDPILAFHVGNGARLAREAGVLPNSRRTDVAALRFGQVLEYPRSWLAERERNHALFAARAADLGGVRVDRAFASDHLSLSARRTPDLARAALGVTMPSAPRLCPGGLVKAA